VYPNDGVALYLLLRICSDGIVSAIADSQLKERACPRVFAPYVDGSPMDDRVSPDNGPALLAHELRNVPGAESVASR
jgi:hypothetical protein